MSNQNNETPLHIRLTGWVGSKIAKKIAEGMQIELVSSVEQQLRIAICNECPNLYTDTRICGLCKCPMDYKTQLKYNPFNELTGEKVLVTCPDKKW